MGKKIVTIIVLLLVLGIVAWAIYDLMSPKVARSAPESSLIN